MRLLGHARIGPATPHIILMGVTTAPIGGQISPTIAQILLTVNRGTSTVPCKRHRHRLRSPRGNAVSCLEKRCLSKCDVFLLRNFAHFFWGITFNALPKCWITSLALALLLLALPSASAVSSHSKLSAIARVSSRKMRSRHVVSKKWQFFFANIAIGVHARCLNRPATVDTFFNFETHWYVDWFVHLVWLLLRDSSCFFVAMRRLLLCLRF